MNQLMYLQDMNIRYGKHKQILRRKKEDTKGHHEKAFKLYLDFQYMEKVKGPS